MDSKKTDEFDWIRETNPMLPHDYRPNIGDVMICVPGFETPYTTLNQGDHNYNYGGCGYEPNKVITVRSTSKSIHTDRIIVWPLGEDCGIYADTLYYYNDK